MEQINKELQRNGAHHSVIRVMPYTAFSDNSVLEDMAPNTAGNSALD